MANYISAIKLPNGDTYQLKDKNALPLTGGTVTGPTSFNDSVDIDDLNVGTLLVNGNATLVNGVQIGGNTQVDKINGVTVGDNPKFTDTTYTFDGTYNASSNKAATVQTVTNAINNLDVTAKTGTTSQTITSISQTNGKIDVTYSNISITKSQVSDFPTSWDLSNISGADDLKAIEVLTGTTGFLKKTNTNTWSLDTNTYLTATTLPAASTSTAGITKVGASGGAAAYDHDHGHLKNAGTITTTATIDSGDRLVIIDSNDSSKINGSSITFGSDQTKFLTNKGTWVVPAGTYSLPTATSSTLGGIKIGYTENGKNYPVELSNGQAYVNVPWTDNNTTYSAGTGLSLNGTTFSNSGVTGVKGNKETSYRTGQVNLTPEDIGAFQKKDYARGTTQAGIRPLVDRTRANRLAFLPADQIIIEKTTDGGVTWEDAGYSDGTKKGLFSTGGSIYIPLKDGVKSTDCGLRVIITGMKYNVPSGISEKDKYNYWNSNYVNTTERYFNAREWWFWVSANNDTIRCIIEKATGANSNNWQTVFNEDFGMTGWSGSNWIRAGNGTTFGGGINQTGNYWNWRITFWSKYADGKTAFLSNTLQAIQIIKCYGDSVWTSTNSLMSSDHLYSYDSNQNATFPAQITATQFNGKLNNININAVVDSFNTGGWSKLNGLLNGSVISVGQNSSMADWNGYAYSSSLVFGCRDTKGLLDMAYSTPMVTFGGTNIAQATEDRPKWYFKLLGTSDKIYTLPSDSKTLAATDGSNATGSWSISITGNAATATGDKNGNDITTTYLPLTGGTLSGKLTVGTTSQNAAPTGAIHVHDIRNYTIPTTMFNSGVNWFFTAKGTPTGKYWSGMHINGWDGDYNAWELVGPSHNEDQRTTPLYVRTGRTTNGWGSWRKIYDSSNVPTKSEIGLGNVENTALSTWAGSNKITTVGTISSGTWNGSVIDVSHGGTGASSFTSGALLIGNGTGAVGTKSIATSIAANSTSTDIPTSSAVAALVASNKQGTLTFALDTTDTKKLIITYSH